jgi:hypothetical protein
MNSYSHSGSTGDTFSSLAVVRCLGAGDFYLKLNNLDNVSRSIGWPNAGRHSGRMTQGDFDFLAPIMEIQSCVNKFAVWNGEEITHELEDRAKHLNSKVWPRNFANLDAVAMGIDLEENFRTLQIDPYVEVDNPTVVPGRPICISRNPYYLDGIPDITQVDEWTNWIERNLMDQAFFVGTPNDHAWFEDTMKVKVHYEPTSDGLALARLIAGAKMMIGNQSMPATLAVGIGTTLWIETRKNTTLDQNEILYPYKSNITYF